MTAIKNYSEIKPNLFKLQIPLPNNPLKELNSYLIKGERNLIIDLGFNRDECESAINDALNQIGVDLNKTDIFITHLHSDYCGLLAKMDRPNVVKYCSKEDGTIINDSVHDKYWNELALKLYEYGYPLYDEKYENAISKHPGQKYKCDKKIDFTYVHDGEILEYGDYRLKCIWAPGHTPGLMCLYEEEKKILFSTDLVLGNITPNIAIEIGIDNPLKQYLNSLDMVSKLDVGTLLTGHRASPTSFLERVEELKNHHYTRLQEVLSILSDESLTEPQPESQTEPLTKPLTAFQVASKMTWDIKYDEWDDFPIAQQWFATGEAAAHLDYLLHNGDISCDIDNEIRHYYK